MVVHEGKLPYQSYVGANVMSSVICNIDFKPWFAELGSVHHLTRSRCRRFESCRVAVCANMQWRCRKYPVKTNVIRQPVLCYSERVTLSGKTVFRDCCEWPVHLNSDSPTYENEIWVAHRFGSPYPRRRSMELRVSFQGGPRQRRPRRDARHNVWDGGCRNNSLHVCM